jgi:DNA-binding transcriptional LysR family regulator
MQLRHLETFVAIVDCGTLTAAATHLFKTQGAVSQDLKALESGLGLELIDRSGQRVDLTPAGRALLPMARRLLAEVGDAQEEMARIRTGDLPIVRVGCLPSLGLTVSQLLADFSARVPAARWSLVTSLRGVMIEGVRAGDLDLAICEAKTDDDITNVPLARESLRVVLSRSHRLAAAARLRPEDLEGVPYIGFARGMGATIEAQRFFSAGHAYPPPTVETTDARLVLDLVARLDGFGIVPDSALPEETDLAIVPTDPPIVRQISVSYLADRVLSAATQAFADYLVESWPRPASRPD